MGGPAWVEPCKVLADGGISNYAFPEPAIQAIRAVCDYANVRATPPKPEPQPDFCEFTEAKEKRITQILDESLAEQRTVLLSHETSEIFTLIGVEAPKTKLATSPEQAAKFAQEITFPVVMKIVSPQIMHKSDCGGVLLNIKTAEEAKAGYATIMENAAKNGPKGAVLKGVEIQ